MCVKWHYFCPPPPPPPLKKKKKKLKTKGKKEGKCRFTAFSLLTTVLSEAFSPRGVRSRDCLVHSSKCNELRNKLF